MINEDFESLKTFVLTEEDLARHAVITEAPWNKGKPGIQKHSEEVKEKIAKAKQGNKNRLGINHTDESKQLMSIAKKGKARSAEARKKISETMKARKRGL